MTFSLLPKTLLVDGTFLMKEKKSFLILPLPFNEQLHSYLYYFKTILHLAPKLLSFIIYLFYIYFICCWSNVVQCLDSCLWFSFCASSFPLIFILYTFLSIAPPLVPLVPRPQRLHLKTLHRPEHILFFCSPVSCGRKNRYKGIREPQRIVITSLFTGPGPKRYELKINSSSVFMKKGSQKGKVFNS